MNFAISLSEEEFELEMRQIDDLMISQSVSIPARQIRGWMVFCQRHKLEGISFNNPLSRKVMGWFQTRYGDRLNLDLDFGSSILTIRGDVFRFRCPLFYGRLLMASAPELLNRQSAGVAVNKPALLNVLELIEGITIAYALSLPSAELTKLHDRIVRTQIRLARISDAGTQRFIPEGRSDIRSSVEQLIQNVPQFGPSKWASLQAVEKFLKAYITQQGGSFKRNHDLEELARSAETLGLPKLSRESFKLIQCPASVRYDSASVDKTAAIKAHHAAVFVCAHISNYLVGRSAWKTGALGRAEVRFEGLPNVSPAILIARSKETLPTGGEFEAEIFQL